MNDQEKYLLEIISVHISFIVEYNWKPNELENNLKNLHILTTEYLQSLKNMCVIHEFTFQGTDDPFSWSLNILEKHFYVEIRNYVLKVFNDDFDFEIDFNKLMEIKNANV